MAKWIYSNGMAVCVNIGDDFRLVVENNNDVEATGKFLSFDIEAEDGSVICGWSKDPINSHVWMVFSM